MSYEAVLFDCDGVLVTLPARRTMREAARRTFASFDLADPSNAALDELLAGDLRAVSTRCRRAGIDRTDFFVTAAREAVRAQCREFEAGLRSLYDDVTAIRSLSASRGLVSDNHRRVLAYLLERFDLAHSFETVRGCSFTPTGFERRKPNPHHLNGAISDLDAVPERTLYVGDRPVDVEAARRAGVDSALVRRRGTSSASDEPNADGAHAGAVADPGREFGGLEPTYRIESLADLHSIAAVA